MIKDLINKEIQSFIFLFMYFAFIIARYRTDSLIDTNLNTFLTILLICGILWESKYIYKRYRTLKTKE